MNRIQNDQILNPDNSWIEYRILRDLKMLPEDHSSTVLARQKMMAHPLVIELIEELQGWPGHVISSHKSAGQLYHKLAFVSELGVIQFDPGIPEIINKVMMHQSKEGLMQLPMSIPVQYGGTGEVDWAWALCDAPTTLYALARMGLKDRSEILDGVHYLAGLVRENGWPCSVSKELGNFRGPGKKSDPCPFANLIMLKLLSQFDMYIDSKETRIGVDCLLQLWEQSQLQHPFQFYMGTDFRKLKAPFIWYDILHVAEVLSIFPFALSDRRLKDMLNVINAKADESGQFTLESVWQAWQGWDFAQKKNSSAWLNFLINRMNSRF